MREVEDTERQVVVITDNLSTIDQWLALCESLHRSLRPDLPTSYADYMKRMFAEGAAMALLLDGETVCGVAVYRSYHTTFHGLRFYLDDLVTPESNRGRGYGGELLKWCEEKAQSMGCDWFDLESGPQRARAHKFYFRHGFGIFSFGFTKSLR